MLMTLVHNVTLLVALSVLWTPILLLRKSYPNLYRILSGMLFGFSAILAMMTPLRFSEGIIYDGRSIVIALSGLYGGGIASLVASLVAGGYRIWLGGNGVYAGVASVTVSALIGLALRRAYRNRPARVPFRNIVIFSIVVHAAVLLCQLLLPWPLGLEVMKNIGPTYLAVLSFGLAVISLSFASIETRTIALQQLHASADFLQDVLSVSPSVVFSLDVESGGIDWISPNAGEILGYEASETVGDGWLSRQIHPGDREKFDSAMRSLRGGTAESFECRFRGRTGGDIWLDVKLRPLPGGRGSAARAIGAMSDITRRTNLARQLLESEELFRLMFSNAPVGIFAFNAGGAITELNENFVSIIGSSRDELLGFDITGLPDGKVSDAVSRCLNGETVVYEDAFGSMSGSRSTPVRAIFSPLVIEGETVGGIAIIVDVSERIRVEAQRRKLEEQLRHSQKLEALGRLAGGIAHDFNNMLSIISGYTELVREKARGNEPVDNELQEILHAVQRSTDIIRQLLTFTRHRKVQPEKLNLNDLIGQTGKMISTLVGENIELRLELAHDLHDTFIDRAMFTQVLTNFASNSKDAIGDAGTITIETGNRLLDGEFRANHPLARPGDYVVMRFSDDGCGMETAMLEMIFEPFFTTKEVGKGTGLGLSIVYGIVNEFNGFVTVESEPGKGTAFSVFLPRFSEERSLAEKLEEKVQKNPVPKRVFVVEDDPVILEVLKKILGHLHQKVEAFGSPAEVIRYAESNPLDFDILISDIIMPGMNGKELYDRLKPSMPALKVVFISGYSDGIIEGIGERSADTYFIHKPFSIDDIKRALNHFE